MTWSVHRAGIRVWRVLPSDPMSLARLSAELKTSRVVFASSIPTPALAPESVRLTTAGKTLSKILAKSEFCLSSAFRVFSRAGPFFSNLRTLKIWWSFRKYSPAGYHAAKSFAMASPCSNSSASIIACREPILAWVMRSSISPVKLLIAM